MSGQREGFSLVEVIVAMVILSVGILAMGASTGYVMTQVRAAQMRTDRLTAVHQVAERLRDFDWEQLEGACYNQTYTADAYTIECEVSRPMGSVNLKQVDLISTGPGVRGTKVLPEVVDTLIIGIARPI